MIRLPADRRPVIAGLGLTEMGPVYGRTAAGFAAEAVRLAVADAGLRLEDVDGLLTSNGTSGGVGLGLQRDLGLFDLRLLSEMQGFGSTAASMVQFAAMAVESGMAGVVACVFADAPLRPGRTRGRGLRQPPATGLGRRPVRRHAAAVGLGRALGGHRRGRRQHDVRVGGPTSHAAVRHDDRRLRAVAVAQRAWAVDNPHAQMRQPITLDDHRESRLIADPFRKLDCCLVSNGGVCVVVTNEAKATDLAQPPVHVLGWAQCHPGRLFDRDPNFGLVTGAARSGPEALAMAGVTVDEVEVAELYDCYTYTVLVSLEDYGFCAEGRGRSIRLQRSHRARREAQAQHRRRSALVLLHVGHDPSVGGGDPGSGPGRRSSGPSPRSGPGKWQRRHPRPPRHPRPRIEPGMSVGPVGRNGATEEFFDGTAAGEFLLRRCRPHGHLSRPQAHQCCECGSTELTWIPASGRARLVSWVVIPARASDGEADRATAASGHRRARGRPVVVVEARRSRPRLPGRGHASPPGLRAGRGWRGGPGLRARRHTLNRPEDSASAAGAPPRPIIVMADGVDGPLLDPETVASTAGLVDPLVILGWVVRTPGWLDSDRRPAYPTMTLLVGAGTRAAVESGQIRSVVARLSAVPGLLAGRLRPAAAVVGAHADSDGWRLAGSPGWAQAAARHAAGVIIERWPGPPPRGAPLVEGKVIDVVERTDPPDPPPRNRPGPEHRVIGELVAGLLPDGATIQWGPGVVGASVVAALTTPVKVRSGLVTDELCDLARRGLLIGPAEAAYVWGGPDLRAMVEDGSLVLHGVETIHDITAISGTNCFVAINTALQVGLDGAANVESVGRRVVAGPGGHPDFSAGASRSPGGFSVVALPATAGGASTIVGRPDVVSTPRTDVDVVVTEYGVADLRGLDDAERADRLLAVAAPEHRHALEAEGRRR